MHAHNSEATDEIDIGFQSNVNRLWLLVRVCVCGIANSDKKWNKARKQASN